MAISSARSVNGNTKIAAASKIYHEMMMSKEVFTRKQVLEAFQSEVGLTKIGAVTYYSRIGKAFKKAEQPSPVTE